jgi:glutaminyl-peptide cyclotransferase
MHIFSKIKICLLAASFSLLFFSCTDDNSNTQTTNPPLPVKAKYSIPKFDGQSAYDFVAKQVAFGHRLPGTETHKQTAEWLVSQFKEYGASVIEQDFTAKVYWGDELPSKNIMAQFNPKAKKRILFAAHWDSRFAGDKDIERADQPIDGADDGGSGVAVLLEIARQLQANPIAAEDLGIDLLLFDAEDQGKDGDGSEDTSLTWCLGSQYWGKNVVPSGYSAKYGILLDMVGSKNPRFGLEGYSMRFNPNLVQKVWRLAQGMGYTDYFVNENLGGVTDDHVFVSTYAGIPMIDIINKPTGSGERAGFGTYHHTHDDNMDIISKKSLRIVGQVMLAVIYKEASSTF